MVAPTAAGGGDLGGPPSTTSLNDGWSAGWMSMVSSTAPRHHEEVNPDPSARERNFGPRARASSLLRVALMGDDCVARLRYRGDVASLHRLWLLLVDHEFSPELAPGPTPDVTVVVQSPRRPGGPSRLQWIMERWIADHPAAELEVLSDAT
jgi:hypothetical protein